MIRFIIRRQIMRLIYADKINAEDVIGGQSEFANDTRKTSLRDY
jgi:hypothetical protein